jgi:hypothetical protein
MVVGFDLEADPVEFLIDRGAPGRYTRGLFGSRLLQAGAAALVSPVGGPLRGAAGDPEDGVFTDGSATPNPGPGGWAAVYGSGERSSPRGQRGRP